MALDIDTRVSGKVIARFVKEQNAAGMTPSIPGGNDLETNAFFLDAIFRRPDTQGRTLFQRWKADGFAGLNNDERFFFEAQSKIRPAAIEVLDVRPGDECLVLDRLDLSAPPAVIHDRSLASISVRFSRFLAMTFPMPHYTRLYGAAVEVPEAGVLEAEEVIAAFASHLGGPSGGEPLRDWLNGNLPLMARAFTALSSEFRRIMVESAAVVETITTYRLRCDPEEFASLMDGHDDTEPQDVPDDYSQEGYCDSWCWLSRKEDGGDALMSIHSVGRPILGNVFLSETRVRLSTIRESRHARLRSAFEKATGRKVEFENEKKIDHTRHLRPERLDAGDKALVPPSLLTHAPRLEFSSSFLIQDEARHLQDNARVLMDNHYRKWLDQSIETLGGLTPRQAAADLVMRPRLACLVKSMIHRTELRRKQDDTDEELSWVAVELGLDELGIRPHANRPNP